MIPTTPAARWQPAGNVRRPLMGQAAPQNILSVTVFKDDAPIADVPVEVMFQDGSSQKGVTGQDGVYSTPYTAAQIGQAVVLITPPEGVEDLGENAAQGVNLQGGGPSALTFDLTGAPVEGSPIIGLGIGALLYGLALA